MSHFLLLYYYLLAPLQPALATNPTVRNWSPECPEEIADMRLEMGDFVGGDTAIKAAARMRRAFQTGLATNLNAGPIPLNLPFDNKEFFSIWNLVKRIQPFYSTNYLGTTGMPGIYPSQSSVTFGSNFIVNRGIRLSETDTLTNPLPSISFRNESINYDPNTEFIMAASILAFESLFYHGGYAVWDQTLRENEEVNAEVAEVSNQQHWASIGERKGFLIRIGAFAYAWSTTWQFYLRNRSEHPEIRTRYWESIYEIFREDKSQLESLFIKAIEEKYQINEMLALALITSMEESGIPDLWNISPLPIRTTKLDHRKLWIKIMLPKNQSAQLFFRKIGNGFWHYLTITETVGELSLQTTVKPNALFLKLPSNELIPSGEQLHLEANLFSDTRSRLQIRSLAYDPNREHFVGKCLYGDWAPELTRVVLSPQLASELRLTP